MPMPMPSEMPMPKFPNDRFGGFYHFRMEEELAVEMKTLHDFHTFSYISDLLT